MILVVDNYDSFTWNLVQYLGELGADLKVIRNDEMDVKAVTALAPQGIVISPGPGTPDQAGISIELIRRLGPTTPVLGVCLGHQALGEAFGGKVVRHEPVHGKTASVEHDGRTIFEGLESPLVAGRYHSLVVDPALPDCLEQSAHAGDVVMAIRHKELPAEGVQFHPESILTDDGKKLLKNFLQGPS